MAGNILDLPVSGDEEPWPPFSDIPPDTGELMRKYAARALRASGVVVLGQERAPIGEGITLGLARVVMPYALANSEN